MPQVLATPVIVPMRENAALNAIRPYLEPGESAVGTSTRSASMINGGSYSGGPMRVPKTWR
jgi:predicted thioesterase